jgi:catechol 2,3-dioxygenase-like lactoylglutathione lyase family enzyme
MPSPSEQRLQGRAPVSIIKRMDHFTIVSDDLDATAEFYAMLGLVIGPRPDFQVPGFWLYAGKAPVLHVIGVAQGKMPEPRRGGLDHMAFRGENLLATVVKLEARGIPYRLFRAPKPYRTWQLFFHDPNGVEVELDFDPAEAGPLRPGAADLGA